MLTIILATLGFWVLGLGFLTIGFFIGKRYEQLTKMGVVANSQPDKRKHLAVQPTKEIQAEKAKENLIGAMEEGKKILEDFLGRKIDERFFIEEEGVKKS